MRTMFSIEMIVRFTIKVSRKQNEYVLYRIRLIYIKIVYNGPPNAQYKRVTNE